jgi:hypothetical protein
MWFGLGGQSFFFENALLTDAGAAHGSQSGFPADF